jgi:hypothetical protein
MSERAEPAALFLEAPIPVEPSRQLGLDRENRPKSSAYCLP